MSKKDSIKEIVNHPLWEESEVIIEAKMLELLKDLPKEGDYHTIAVHALANQKAYEMLSKWMKEMGFHKGLIDKIPPRDYS